MPPRFLLQFLATGVFGLALLGMFAMIGVATVVQRRAVFGRIFWAFIGLLLIGLAFYGVPS